MENIKIVNCGVCGIEMMVSKFASNTPNCSDCRAEVSFKTGGKRAGGLGGPWPAAFE